MIWTPAKLARAVELCVRDGKTGEEAAEILSIELNVPLTRNALIGALVRHGIRLSELDPGRRSRAATKALQDNPGKVRLGLVSKAGGPPLDSGVTRLLKSDAFVVPPKDAQSLLIRDGGKLRANDNLHERACRYFYGDPLKHADGYCGKATVGVPGRPYCFDHFRRIYPGALIANVADKPSKIEMPNEAVMEPAE